MFHTRLIASISSKTSLKFIPQLSNKVDGFEYILGEEEPPPATIYKWVGGDERHLLLHLEQSPEFVDLDHQTPLSLLQKIASHFPHIKIITSYHNFESTPNDLPTLYHTLCNPYAHHIKIATYAHSTLDALRMLHLVRETKCIGLCMGPLGTSTRILAPIVGTPIMYAAPTPETATAPGQLTVDELIDTYHFHTLSADFRIYALIGDPVTKSPSHITHNRVFRSINVKRLYIKWHVRPDELLSFFSLIETLPVDGLSVTMPHKESLPGQTGPINTLVRTSTGWKGHNTDGSGALDALGPVSGKTLLILGAGGSAKAIALEAKKRGASVFIHNRTPERGEECACTTGTTYTKHIPAHYDMLINTTPNPMPIDHILPNTTVMDLSHTPTLLLETAEKLGCRTVTGFEMFIRQAQGQFKLWLDKEVPFNLISGKEASTIHRLKK